MYKTLAIVVSLVFAGGSAVYSIHDQDPIQEPVPIQRTPSRFMQRKLTAAREIVAGLALEDYDKIAENAQELMLLSHDEEWQVLTTDKYLRLSSQFRGSEERLRDRAKEKNLDGATFAYFEVTMNCVQCHKYVRKTPPANR